MAAEVAAWLLDERAGTKNDPALTIHKYGDGIAAMWAFDLAKSVAYTRQGNPEWANQERDGLDGIRTVDMFKDWIDLERIHIPQVDEQQRLFVNLLTLLGQSGSPLPRLWYFPGDAKCMLIATGDSHMNPAPSVESIINLVESYGGHISIYYSPTVNSIVERMARRIRSIAADIPLLDEPLAKKFTAPTKSDIRRWRERGHEFALHPYIENGLEESWLHYWKEYTGLGYGPVSPTARTHLVNWEGWAESARVQAMLGIRMNLDYYHAGPLFVNGASECVTGHFTGSGLPMKFVDQSGRVMEIYQQNTQLVDEHFLDMPWGNDWPKVGSKNAIKISESLMQSSLAGSFCAIATQFHVDPFFTGGYWMREARNWLQGTLDFAMKNDIPIWSAEEWLEFVNVRQNACMDRFKWNPEAGELSFDLSTEVTPLRGKLTLMFPNQHYDERLTGIRVNNKPSTLQEFRAGGITYSGIHLDPGRFHIKASYS
ncbi:MAG: hypothetical protein MUO58_06910 [Anaerolineales bacterium]|nr:hypothetical protein [Anaerolineales bacterium]